MKKEYADYFIKLNFIQNSDFNLTQTYLGYKIDLNIEDEKIDELTFNIISFIVEIYLKDAIFSKIYDEYYFLDATDAGGILINLTKELAKSHIHQKIKDMLKIHGVFVIESYVIFNIKPIMISVYNIVEKSVYDIIYQKKGDFKYLNTEFSDELFGYLLENSNMQNQKNSCNKDDDDVN